MAVTYTVGDTREVIKGIPDGSVDLVASSPPFLALRSYVPADHESKGDEIGSEANPAEFIDMLLGLTAEWGRVLAPHGSLAIELGDTYSGSGGGGGDYLPGGLRYGQVGFDGSAAREHNAANWRQKNQRADGRDIAYGTGAAERPDRTGRNNDAWPRAKSLALIPQLYAIALAYGINPLTGQPSPAGRWLVRNVIVWHRPNPAVGALGDKVRPSTSYIVIATRSAKRWFDLTAVRGDWKNPVQVNNVTPRHKADIRNDNGTPYYSAGHANGGAPPLDAWFDHYDGTHDTWTLTTQPSRLAHYAMWPAKLAERLILSMCPLEVCRVCGEPRRRMESSEYISHGKINGNENKGVRGFGVQNGEHAQSMEHGRATKIPTTLGWTDCGCKIVSTLDPEEAGLGNGSVDTVEGAASYRDVAGVNTLAPSTPPHDGYRPGLVLDPFAGSGTTLATADLHDRDAIGIDFNPANRDLYPARYDEVKRALYGTPAPMPGQETFDFAI